MVMGALVEPPLIPPVAQSPLFSVGEWVIESELTHATVCPTVIVADAGVNDMFPLIPVIVIVRFAELDGAEGVLLPQLVPRRPPETRTTDTATNLDNRLMI
jgi:hypothetical protein